MTCTCLLREPNDLEYALPASVYRTYREQDRAACEEHRAAYDAEGIVLIEGDVLDVLPTLDAESVNTVITSPPFWGLRAYSGCPASVWGGSPDCDHQLEPAPMAGEGYADRRKWQHDGVSRQTAGDAWVKERVYKDSPTRTGDEGIGFDDAERTKAQRWTESDTCARCGAWRGWYGLEPEPDCLAWARGEEPCSRCYVCHTRTVLRLLRRVLRKDGVLFWDIDDSRAGSWGNYHPTGKGGQRPKATERFQREAWGEKSFKPPQAEGRIPAKNLALIPERVALAAQSDGWIVRSICVIPTWMPESARDRPTDAYRKVLIMAKSGRYNWDATAVRQPLAESSLLRIQQPTIAGQRGGEQQRGEPYQGSGNGNRAADMVRSLAQGDGSKNLPNIWSLPPSSSVLPGSHFAAFPLEEPELCIKAACPADGLILDPFVGTGTALVAARKLSRRAIGIEASPEFVAGCVERLRRGDDGLKEGYEMRERMKLLCEDCNCDRGGNQAVLL